MNLSATIFEIREFSIFDGAGIRTTVFLKGCPLRCAWCHNPEGIAFEPQILFNAQKCRHCGNCLKEHAPDALPESFCPTGAKRLCGFRMDSDELAAKLLRQADVYAMSGGGVTFSGGEPLAQAPFVREVMRKLHENGVQTAVETSGAVSPEFYRLGLEFCDFVFQDLKHPTPEGFRHYCGGDLALVLRNVEKLKASGKPFVFRIPLIPEVNDSLECMTRFAELAVGIPTLQRVEILPYHLTAGAKYHLVGLEYKPEFPEERTHEIFTAPFEERGIPWKIL